MRVLLILFCLLLPLNAQERKGPKEIMKPRKGFRMTDRILFVVDTSCSMDGYFDKAVDAVLTIAQSSMDGFQVGLITFSDIPVRWKGFSEHRHPKKARCGKHCVPANWAAMPKMHKQFTKYLKSSLTNGLTDANVAMVQAMATRRERVTIVLITDGEFNEDILLGYIRTARKWRKKQKLDRIDIMVWGIGKIKLKKIAKEGGGGLWNT